MVSFVSNRRYRLVEYLTITETRVKCNISAWMVTIYCKENRINLAIKKGNLWLALYYYETINIVT